MRQLVGPRGGAVRQDVLDVSSENDDFAASVAYRVSKKRKGEKDEDGGDEGGKGGVKVGGQTPNTMNRKTGSRNRCNWRKSEYHLLPN